MASAPGSMGMLSSAEIWLRAGDEDFTEVASRHGSMAPIRNFRFPAVGHRPHKLSHVQSMVTASQLSQRKNHSMAVQLESFRLFLAAVSA
jgi:hypothetical protein